jgi:hypothetical protein
MISSLFGKGIFPILAVLVSIRQIYPWQIAAYVVFEILFGSLLGWILGIQREKPYQSVMA